MSFRMGITVVLLLFVGVSVGYLLTGSSKGERAASGEGVPPVVEQGHKVVAYYFHGNARCRTCKSIEAETSRVLHADFSEALEQGSLVWETVNLDQPANAHFVDDFQLTSRIVVIADVVDGIPVRWTSLDRVWELIGDEEAFEEYVRTATAGHLDGARG